MQGPTDWYAVSHNKSLPHTCCPDTQDDGSCTIDSPNKYNDSCLDKLRAIFQRYGAVIGAVGIGIATSQVNTTQKYEHSVIKTCFLLFNSLLVYCLLVVWHVRFVKNMKPFKNIGNIILH